MRSSDLPGTGAVVWGLFSSDPSKIPTAPDDAGPEMMRDYITALADVIDSAGTIASHSADFLSGPTAQLISH